jgi:hypothetical protein
LSEREDPGTLAFSDVRQLGKELIEFLLTLIELATADVVDAKECHDTVDDEKTVFVTDEVLGNFVQKLHLML